MSISYLKNISSILRICFGKFKHSAVALPLLRPACWLQKAQNVTKKPVFFNPYRSLGLAWIFLFEELNLFIKESELCVALDTTLHTMVWNRSTPVPHFSTLPHIVEKIVILQYSLIINILRFYVCFWHGHCNIISERRNGQEILTTEKIIRTTEKKFRQQRNQSEQRTKKTERRRR